jgi:hypothetical protein
MFLELGLIFNEFTQNENKKVKHVLSGIEQGKSSPLEYLE